MTYSKKFNIKMTDGKIQTVEADYYSYDAATYIFWRYNRDHEACEVYRVQMISVDGISSFLQG